LLDLLVFVAIVTVLTWLCASVGRRLAEQKGRSPDEGYWLGMLLGSAGLLVEMLLPSQV
jgi:hypothetical protein